MRPHGCQGCQKNQKDPRINIMMRSVLIVSLNWTNFEKLSEKTVRKQSFLIDFLDFMRFLDVHSIWAGY